MFHLPKSFDCIARPISSVIVKLKGYANKSSQKRENIQKKSMLQKVQKYF